MATMWWLSPDGWFIFVMAAKKTEPLLLTNHFTTFFTSIPKTVDLTSRRIRVNVLLKIKSPCWILLFWIMVMGFWFSIKWGKQTTDSSLLWWCWFARQQYFSAVFGWWWWTLLLLLSPLTALRTWARPYRQSTRNEYDYACPSEHARWAVLALWFCFFTLLPKAF